MAELKKRKGRGLPSIAKAREDRGNGRARWTTQAGLVALGAIVAGFVVHKIVSERELGVDRETLLSRQRAVEVTLGPEWFPLRDALEADVLAAARDYEGDQVADQARTGAFKTLPGLYLRMRVADARDAASVRRVAADAKKDAFAACLLREPNDRGARGETDGGAFAEQPWNLGQAYAATRVLTPGWVDDVKTADDDLRLRVFNEQFEKATKTEIPFAIDVVKRASFFLLVLDEDTPEAASFVEEAGGITEEALQMVPHDARVYLFDLATKRPILRLKRSGDARVIPAGQHVVADSETRDAMQRQANNCALARRVDEALSPAPTASASPSGK